MTKNIDIKNINRYSEVDTSGYRSTSGSFRLSRYTPSMAPCIVYYDIQIVFNEIRLCTNFRVKDFANGTSLRTLFFYFSKKCDT